MTGTFAAHNNGFPIEPDLPDLLSLWKKDILLTLNCHAVGTIVSFNSTNQTASATVNYAMTFSVQGANGPETQLRDYPVMSDCPVVFLGGSAGEAYLTFPIQAGDQCLVLFNDRDIDNWFTNNGNQTNSNRLHSFSDAVLIVGLRPANSAIASFDMNRILLKKGNAVVGVGMNNELVKIANELFTLKQLLTNLVNAVKGLSIDVAGVGPAQGTVDPTSIAALNTVVSQIGQVLE